MSDPSGERFLDNMAALWRADPRLALAIDELPVDAMLPIERARTGAPTAAVDDDAGRRTYLHSRYDPADEAERLCAQLDDDDEPALTVVLCGLGLGHHLPSLFGRLGPDGQVVAVEQDAVTIKSALHCQDVAEAIAARRLVFLHTEDKGDLHAKLDQQAAALMLGLRFVVPPPYRHRHLDFQDRMRTRLTEFAAFTRMSLVSLVANARITCRNIANNLPAILSTPSIGALRNRFRGYPGVVVAAGPSLGRNVDQLRTAADRAVIVAVQTTLKPLLARDIRPDFVTSLDFSDLSKRFFEGLDLSGIHLVAEPKASWHVIDTFLSGPPGTPDRPNRLLSFLDNDFARRCVGNALAARAGLRAGSTVAHLAFYLAEYLGCDPIILVGQDLGFSGGVYYTSGVAMHDAWRSELGRFCSLETKEWERIVRARNILHRTTDVHGQPIFTDEQMLTYKQQFERDFAASAARVIDATEGGVVKKGTAVMTLAEALADYAVRAKPAESTAAPADDRGLRPAAGSLVAGQAELQTRLDELVEFRGLCSETRDLLTEMKEYLDRPAEFDRRIIRVDELRAMVHVRSRIFRMVSDVSQQGELQKLKADRRLEFDRSRSDAGGDLPAKKRATRQLERDGRFVDALLEGCDVLEEILTSARDRTDALIREME